MQKARKLTLYGLGLNLIMIDEKYTSFGKKNNFNFYLRDIAATLFQKKYTMTEKNFYQQHEITLVKSSYFLNRSPIV